MGRRRRVGEGTGRRRGFGYIVFKREQSSRRTRSKPGVLGIGEAPSGAVSTAKGEIKDPLWAMTPLTLHITKVVSAGILVGILVDALVGGSVVEAAGESVGFGAQLLDVGYGSLDDDGLAERGGEGGGVVVGGPGVGGGGRRWGAAAGARRGRRRSSDRGGPSRKPCGRRGATGCDGPGRRGRGPGARCRASRFW